MAISGPLDWRYLKYIYLYIYKAYVRAIFREYPRHIFFSIVKSMLEIPIFGREDFTATSQRRSCGNSSAVSAKYRAAGAFFRAGWIWISCEHGMNFADHGQQKMGIKLMDTPGVERCV